MYDYIKGSLARVGETYAVVDASGIGYKISTSAKSLREAGKAGDSVCFYTHLHVREDIFEIYGFTTAEERSTFELLISVSGVGPKAALNILSSVSGEDLALAIATGDYKTVTKAQGVGQKLAQRIILELKDKIKTEDFIRNNIIDIIPSTNLESEAIEALVVLGYSPPAAAKAVKSAGGNLSLEDTIRHALKYLL
ncbi:MAG: Holliday junction ATP-dependent DNA helicase RuvA [Firmicutes bacterium ADurb.Bin193]|nr:MAG: Holliday junction ATP-dependent DNA helicase RuvA [Firmicutes bacterium ADurb.Bin193]